jgi:hypothetical protein
MCAVVNCIVCELAIALELLVVRNCVYNLQQNSIFNPNPVYSHPLYTLQIAILVM